MESIVTIVNLNRVFRVLFVTTVAALTIMPGSAQETEYRRDFMAVVSPDQSKLAFYSYRGESSPDIFLLDLETDRESNITESSTAWDIEPAWSPDGRHIAFGRGTSMGDMQIQMIDVVDGSIETLTDDDGSNSRPVFSRDGRYLVYHQRLGSDRAFIVRIDLETREKQRISDEALISAAPYTSPVSDLIAYIGTDPATRKADVYVMNLDGKESRRVTSSDINERSARFTPDGQHLVVAFEPEGGTTGLYLTDLEGMPYRPLSTIKDAHTYSASFSPDGKSIYYDIGSWDGDFLIYRSNFDEDGLEPIRVTGTDSSNNSELVPR